MSNSYSSVFVALTSKSSVSLLRAMRKSKPNVSSPVWPPKWSLPMRDTQESGVVSGYPGTAPKAMDVITPAGTSQATELDPTLGPVTVHGVPVP